MALLFMDSFDHYVTADLTEKWSSVVISGTSGALNTINTTGGRRSSGAWRYTPGNDTLNAFGYIQKNLPATGATVVCGFAFNPSGASGGSGMPIFSVLNGATSLTYLRLNSDLTLSVGRGGHSGSPTLLGTTAAVTAGAFTYVEIKLLLSATVGTVDVRFNGVSVLSLTAQNTAAATTWTNIRLGLLSAAVGNSIVSGRTYDYDDLYVLDGAGAAPLNDLLGDVRVDARRPTAAGAVTGWTPLAGANWDAVNDTTPDDDTTYTSTSTVSATDTFVTEDAPIVGATIFGVQHCLAMKKADAGTCTVAPVIRHGTTNYPGAPISPGTSYSYGVAIAATNPGTGLAWTEAGFNAAEFGYTRTG